MDNSKQQQTQETQVTQEKQEQQPSELEQRLQSLNSIEEESDSTSTQEEQPSPNNQMPSLDELDLPTQQPQATPTQEQQVKPELPDTEEARKFAKDFKEYLGFDITELRTGMEELNQLRQSIREQEVAKVHQTEMQTLQKEWGVDESEFDGRMNRILERFQKYSPDMQKRLDNLEGAKLIWAKLQQEDMTNNVPQFQSSSAKTNGGKKPMFTKAEIKGMSREEYERNADAILKAYKLGLVQ